MNLDWYEGGKTATSYPRLKIWQQAPGCWRVLATDDCEDTDFAGPPYRTKAEAHAAVLVAPELEGWRHA